MNRLANRPWFLPGLATVCYLAGFNDELLHLIGSAWLDLARSVQTIVVLIVLGLITYLVVDRVRQRRSYYAAAVRAAATTRFGPGTVGAHTTHDHTADLMEGNQ